MIMLLITEWDFTLLLFLTLSLSHTYTHLFSPFSLSLSPTTYLLGAISMSSRPYYAACILAGITALHNNGLMHRYVNPNAIYFTTRGVPMVSTGHVHVCTNNWTLIIFFITILTIFCPLFFPHNMCRPSLSHSLSPTLILLSSCPTCDTASVWMDPSPSQYAEIHYISHQK